MTRLHYLAARNNGKLPFGLLSKAAKRILDAQTMAEETRGYGYIRMIPVSRNCTPDGHHFAPDRIFHIREDQRPPGIPDDIHESYK